MFKCLKRNIIIFMCCALVFSMGTYISADDSSANDISKDDNAAAENPLNDRTIKDGVVIDNEKDKKDLDVEHFKKVKKKETGTEHNYTLGPNVDLNYKSLFTFYRPMPPKGKNVDNIDQTPDPYNQNLLNVPFGDYVVFYPQHQDDEVLWAGSTIINAINERGADHVFVVLVSPGTGHKIFRSGRFSNMTLKEKAEYRNREFEASCRSLGIPEKNIIMLYKQRDDWKTDFNLEKEFALKMEKKYRSVTHITHSYKYDDHFMHRANGQTLYNLYKKGEIKDLRFYIKPFLLNYVNSEKNILNVYSVNNKKDYEKIKHACMAYKYVNPLEKRYGIGYRTDYMSFDKLVYDKNERSFIIIQKNRNEG